jgi:hypothetical protein
MIRPTKGLTPIYVHYFDNQSATIYNLTEEQYNHIIDTEEEPHDILDKFEVSQDGDIGYANPEIVTLATIYGFGVESE